MAELALRYDIIVTFGGDTARSPVQSAVSEIIMEPAIASVMVDHRIDTDRKCLRIILGFEDESAFSRVRTDPDHQASLRVIERNVDEIETSVWEPTAVQLADGGS